MTTSTIVACLGVYLTAFTILWTLFKDARSKLVLHYKFYDHRAEHVTTKKLFEFFKKRVTDFPLEKGTRTDEKIMPYIIDDLRRCTIITIVLNIMTLRLFHYLS